MKLSIYLFRSDVKSFDGLIQDKHLSGSAKYRELALRKNKTLPFTCQAYVQSNKQTEPKWAGFLGGHFDMSKVDLVNATSSFVLLLKASNRYFAVTFGYGFTALDRSRIEPRFGLMVALNELAANEIRTLDTHTSDIVTRQRRTHVSVASPVSEFGINTNIDWVRFVSGKPSTASLAKNVSGADSLAINCDCQLQDVAGKCKELLKRFSSTDYQKKFPFVDHFQPVPKDDPVTNVLEAALDTAIANRSTERISVTYPDLTLTDNDQLAVYRMGCGHTQRDVEEVTLQDVYSFFHDDVPGDKSLDQVWIIGLNDQDAAVSKKYKLRDYFVFETDHDGHTYLLSLGHWFRVNKDYIAEVRKRVAALPDVSQALAPVPIKHGEDEGDYNARLATDKGWLLLDKANFHVGSYDKIEICDVLTKDRQFISVKKMKSSATLSHLFAQASVSASMLRRSPDYMATVLKQAGKQWSAVRKDADWAKQGTFVYAIPTEKAGTLSDCMFFFSQVNLLEHVETIKLANYDVALCKIEYDPASYIAPTVPKKKTGSTKKIAKKKKAKAS